MSEHDPSSEREDEILDTNLERLLSHTPQRARVPDDARARMLAGLQDGRTKARGRVAPSLPGRSRNFRLTIAAGAVALAAALVLAWVLGLGERLIGERATPQLATYQYDGLGARSIRLSDGSTALLRAGTQLEQLGPRHLRLIAGEVLLDVKAAAEPLAIETAHGRALVLGTQMLVRSDAVQTLAAVLRGEATLESSSGGERASLTSASSLLLHAGEQALLLAEAAPTRIAGRRLSFEIDWARELLAPETELEPMRRGNLLARVPRWTGQLQRSAEWPLPVRELIVDVHVEDGQVRTTIDQTFFNHLQRDLEGVYQFPLPPDAAISRLAMYVDGERMEAGVVARDRGRDIYEQIVHRRRDPALLEWMQGNLFQVRIFPLPGRTEKRVLLSYTAALDELYGRGELRVPIPALDLPVGKVSYRVRVVGAAGREFVSRNQAFELRNDGEDLLAEFSAVDHSIGADIVATLSSGAPGLAPPSVEHHRARHDDGRRHVGLRLRPDLRAEFDALGEQATAAPARDLVLLFDSSASRGPAELDAQRRFVAALLEHLDAADRVAVLRFDTQLQWATPSLEPLATLDREALAATLARVKVGLGATDLGAAVDAGLERLEAASPPTDDKRERVPMLVYLGDGLAQELDGSAGGSSGGSADWVERVAARVRGRATFVGVSFGPAYDEPALTRLAAAGDGLHLHVGEGEPVSWRALELLTTLSTTRVLDLDAQLLDASDQTIASGRTHASARSVADGETFELLAELGADEADPIAVQLRGRVAGETWTKRIELPPPTDGARWLPRKWARAHVAALTEAGVEANAEEITKLGLEHFLVTPTTSLLVLENEKMYRDFDVHRPPPDAWASYAAPDRIEVVREGVTTVAGHGQYVVRTPVQMLVDYSNGGSSGWGDVRTRGFGPMAPLASAQPLGGLGLTGTGRGGGGFGFGMGSSRTIGLGSNGVIGKGGGAGFGGRGTIVDVPKRGSSSPASTNEFGGFVARNNAPLQWQSNKQTSIADTPDVARFDGRFAGTVVGGELSRRHGGGYASAQPWPQARHYTRDPRIDDLGELVPALFEEPFDLAREQLLLTGLDGSRGSVSEDAAQLIEAARAAQADVRFKLPEGGTLDIDAHGHFSISSERWGFLDEQVSYDGEQLRADYPELGLSVARAVGATSPALFGEWVPWLVPPADHLAHFYVVERSGPLQLTLRPIGDAERELEARSRLEVELDASHRVTKLHVYVGEQLVSTSEFRHADTTLTLVVDGQERTLERLGRAHALTSVPQATRVELPLPSPADLALALDGHTPGDAAWIALQQQRLAGYAALGSSNEQLLVLDALREHAGRILPGELALAGAALHQASPAQRAAILDAAEGPMVEYLRASTSGNAGALAKLAAREDLRHTPVGFLASYRTVLREAERSSSEASLRRLESFLRDYQHPTHAYVATMQSSNRWWQAPARKTAAWLALAEQDNRFKYIALHQAGLARYQHGDYVEAGELFSRSFEAAAEDRTLPIIDWSVQWTMTQALGEAGWQLAWTRLRERVAASHDPELVLRFLASAQQIGRLDDAQRVIAGLDPENLDPELALRLFDALVAYGRMGEAGIVLASLRERPQLRDAIPVVVRAADFAEQQGRLDDAAVALEQALLGALAQEGLTLDELRRGFSRLFELRGRLAQPIAADASEREAALARALAVADRWRLEDPDNQDIDRLCAELLWSLGRGDEAWRQLASTLDRHGAEGEALAWVADALERGGDLDRADAVWARAIGVEPTDPTHRLRRAQNMLATGQLRAQQAHALLDEITTGTWQPRFAFVVDQARRLRELAD
jgi:ferric-dicitrate binding protein FerR (iron transport regulator)/tetratricopeptide (TPR) repeat protein